MLASIAVASIQHPGSASINLIHQTASTCKLRLGMEGLLQCGIAGLAADRSSVIAGARPVPLARHVSGRGSCDAE